jgi:hypothetical protein
MPVSHVAQALDPGDAPVRYRSSAAQARRGAGAPAPRAIWKESPTVWALQCAIW